MIWTCNLHNAKLENIKIVIAPVQNMKIKLRVSIMPWMIRYIWCIGGNVYITPVVQLTPIIELN